MREWITAHKFFPLIQKYGSIVSAPTLHLAEIENWKRNGANYTVIGEMRATKFKPLYCKCALCQIGYLILPN